VARRGVARNSGNRFEDVGWWDPNQGGRARVHTRARGAVQLGAHTVRRMQHPTTRDKLCARVARLGAQLHPTIPPVPAAPDGNMHLGLKFERIRWVGTVHTRGSSAGGASSLRVSARCSCRDTHLRWLVSVSQPAPSCLLRGDPTFPHHTMARWLQVLDDRGRGAHAKSAGPLRQGGPAAQAARAAHPKAQRPKGRVEVADGVERLIIGWAYLYIIWVGPARSCVAALSVYIPGVGFHSCAFIVWARTPSRRPRTRNHQRNYELQNWQNYKHEDALLSMHWLAYCSQSRQATRLNIAPSWYTLAHSRGISGSKRPKPAKRSIHLRSTTSSGGSCGQHSTEQGRGMRKSAVTPQSCGHFTHWSVAPCSLRPSKQARVHVRAYLSARWFHSGCSLGCTQHTLTRPAHTARAALSVTHGPRPRTHWSCS